jgi:hypothetical protein
LGSARLIIIDKQLAETTALRVLQRQVTAMASTVRAEGEPVRCHAETIWSPNEHGADNVVLVIQGALADGDRMEEAGFAAWVKAAPVEQQQEAAMSGDQDHPNAAAYRELRARL